MKLRPVLNLCGLCALAAIAAPTAASEPGNLMNMTVTSKMQMPGSPYGNMPATTHTNKVCTSAKGPDPRELMKRHDDSNCQVTDYKRIGDTISYHMACGGNMQMTGDGTFQLKSGGDISGRMHIAGNTHGQNMVMDMNFDGQHIGSCDYTPPKVVQ